MKEQSQSTANRREPQTNEAARRQQAEKTSKQASHEQANLGQKEADKEKKSEAELKHMSGRQPE
jgi:hypothetical protein